MGARALTYMSISKILNTEIEENAVSSLSTRPSSPSLYGGRVLSAKELRAAFDKLPILLAERFNALIDALGLYTDEKKGASLAALVATGIAEGHSLAELFADVTSGRFSTYLSLDGEGSLAEVFGACKAELTAFEEALTSLREGKEALLARLTAQEKAQAEATAAQSARADAIEKESREAILSLRSALPHGFRIAEVPSSDYAKVYRLEYCEGERETGEASYAPVAASVDINIPRDLVVKSGKLCTCEVAGVPVSTYEVGEAYIDLTLSSENADHIYIRVGDLVKTTIIHAEGKGDVVTGITAVGNSLTLHKGLSSADFAKKAETEAMKEQLAALPPHTLTDEKTGRVYLYSLALQDGMPGILLTEKA